MILWYVGAAVFGVWNVFQTSGLDFRLVALGALAPLALDAPGGAQGVAHSLLASALLLAAVVIGTSGRRHRLARRRLIGLPIGSFAGLVLSASWRHPEVFWWPAFGASVPHVPLLPPWPVVAVEEVVGAAAIAWAVHRFGLGDPVRRRTLWRTGRLHIVPS